MTEFTRYTGSELFFKIASELAEISLRGDEKLLATRIIEYYRTLNTERPASTASFNLLRMVSTRLLEKGTDGLADYISELKTSYDRALWKAAEIASRRIVDGDVVLTNSNSLAIRRLLETIRNQGRKIELYVTESRPGKEGLLIAEYAEQLGFKVNLIVDSAARFFIKEVSKVFIGAEAIAANGAVVSKIGSGLIALVAHEARRRVFIVAPTLKFNYETIYGELLKLPEGGADLIIEPGREGEPPEGFVAKVPLYEVIPPEYIDGIATEYGLIAPQAVPLLLRNIYGSYPPEIPTLSQLVELLASKYGVRIR